MPTVNVDLADLEKIVFATAAIKSIESALTAHKNDPFVRPHLNYTDAHNRLAAAMRNATRAQAETAVKWDEPLNEAEMSALKDIDGAMGGIRVVSVSEKGEAGMSVWDRLAAKGCVKMGQYVKGVMWAGAQGPELVGDPKGFAARLTQRGRDKLT